MARDQQPDGAWDAEPGTDPAPRALAAPARPPVNRGGARAFDLPSRLYGRYPGFITLGVLCTLAALVLGDLGRSHDWYGGEALAYRALAEEVIKGDFPPGGPYAGLPTHLPPLYPVAIGAVSRLTGLDTFEVMGMASVAGAILLPVVAYFTGKLLFEDWRPAAAGAAMVTFGAGFSSTYLGDRALFTSGHLFTPVTPLGIGLLMIPLAAALFIRAVDGDTVKYGVRTGVIAALIAVTHLQSLVYLVFVILVLGAAWLVVRPADWRKTLALYITIALAGLGLSAWWWGPQLWTGLREGGIVMQTAPSREIADVGVGSWPREFGIVLLLALGGSALAVIMARRQRKLAPVMAVAWFAVPLFAGAFFGDRLPLEATLRGDRLALVASFPMALLAGLALAGWRDLVPRAPGAYAFLAAAAAVLIAALPTLDSQRDLSRAQGEPVYGGREWRREEALGFALYLRDEAPGAGTSTVVGDDPESAIAWFFAGNKPLAWSPPAFYSMAYNVREVTGISQAGRIEAQAEALSGTWSVLERVASREEVQYAILTSLEDGRLALSVATAQYLATRTEQRGREVLLKTAPDGLSYLAMEPGGVASYAVRSAMDADTQFSVRLRSAEPGVVLELRAGPTVVEVDVREEEVGEWVEIPLVLPLIEGENVVEVTAVAPLELAAIYAYTEALDTIPPGYRLRFDDGYTVVVEIPRL